MQKILKEIRLIAAVGLLLVPIVLLGWLFVVQSSKDITFAQQELDGLHYLQSVLPIHRALSKGQTTASKDEIIAFRSARHSYETALKVTEDAEQFEHALSLPGISNQQKLQRSQLLITSIADQSNLILDPELDTYYLMEVAVMRIPEIMRLTSLVAEFSAQTGGVSKNQQVAIVAADSIRSEFDAIYSALNKVKANTASGTLSADLESLSKASSDFGIKTSYQISTPLTTGQNTFEFSLAERTMLIDALFFQWEAVDEELERLLNIRIEKFETRFYVAMGISILVTMTALMLAVTVLRKLYARLDDRIVFLAHHDPMTQLKNRASFTADMANALKEADRNGEVLALHVIDCDNFKMINDTHGHPAGDAVLQHLAKCLLAQTRKGDIVGRLGGDEFVILQRNINETNNGLKLAERIAVAMRKPVHFGEIAISSTVTIGVSLYPHHASDATALMLCSDTTLYAAKTAGRNQALCFTRDLESKIAHRKNLENEIRNAIQEDRLFLNFQPQFDTTGRELRGFEALLRLKDSNGVLIPPDTFIPIAESLGLIIDYGIWVLKYATEIAAGWPSNIMLAVNLSPLQFKNGSVSNTVRMALERSGLPATRLQVEITEGILLEETKSVFEELEVLRNMGVSIAMDDFGTGFSSLSYLWRFRFNKIKIDRSFILALDTDRTNAENILKTIIMLGHSLAMEVTAEGIETSQQAALMRRLKCDEIQGYLFGRPLPEEDLAAVILKSFKLMNEPTPLAEHTIEALLA